MNFYVFISLIIIQNQNLLHLSHFLNINIKNKNIINYNIFLKYNLIFTRKYERTFA